MAFVADSPTFNTGDLISDNTWNQDLVDNPNFLKGLAGPVTIEDDIIPGIDTFGVPFAVPAGKDLGLGGVPVSAKRWQDIHGVRLFGNRYQADQQRRTVRLKWQSLGIGAADAFVDHHMVKTIVGASVDAVEGGLGQIVLGVDRALSGRSIQLDQRLSSLAPGSFTALDNRFGGSRFPYLRIEFAFTATSNSEGIFLGLRDTPGAGFPLAGEEHMGLQFALGIWSAIMGDTTNKDLITFTSSVAVGTRQVFEIAVLSSTVGEFYINGTFGGTFATNSIPSGLMELSLLLFNAVNDAGRIDVTIGETVLQEDRV